MSDERTTKGRTIRNLVIMLVVTVGVGWLSLALNEAMGATSPDESLGMLLWMAAPCVTTLLLRLVASDGWRDLGLAPRPRSNLGWYSVSLLYYPVATALVLAIGGAFGAISFHGLVRAGWGGVPQLVAMQLVASLLKSVFEEFSWRGYLTPKIDSLGVHPFVNHLIVGVVWSAWHIPYWTGLLSQASFESTSRLGLTLFIVLNVIGLITSAILHGELRLATGSLWPPLILHCMGNGITLALLQDGLVKMSGRAKVVFAPGMAGGLLSILLTALAGVAVYLIRTRVRSRGARARRM